MDDKVYDNMYQHEEDFWWHKGMRSISQALFGRYIYPSMSNNILDAGCGTGGMFSLLEKYGQVFGVDISSKAIAYAKKRGQAHEASVMSLPFPDGYFDAIVSNDVLYHRDTDIIKALTEYRRTMKAGGFLFIREPAYDWLRGNIDEATWTSHRFTKKELFEILTRQGFLVLKTSYVNFLLFPLALMVRFLKINSNDYEFKTNIVLNTLFSFLLKVEAKLLPFCSFPFGLSIVCVAKKIT